MAPNNNSGRTVLVVGATGNQGSAVVDQLLRSEVGFNILALTRDSTTGRAQAVAEKGDAVEVVEGDLGEQETLSDLAARADAVFAVINFWTLGYERQVRYGRNLAAVLGEADGIRHVVYSGVANQDRDTGIPHFDSSQEISDALRAEDLPLTILKPVFFMENWEVMLEDIAAGTLAFPLAESQPHQQTCYYDVARATRIAFENPHEFIGTEHDLVSDVGTLAEIVETINEIGGFDAEPYYVPVEDAYEEFGEEFGRMTEWWQENASVQSFFGNPSETEETFGFEPQSLEEYLGENGWEGGKREPAYIVGWAKAMGYVSPIIPLVVGFSIFFVSPARYAAVSGTPILS